MRVIAAFSGLLGGYSWLRERKQMVEAEEVRAEKPRYYLVSVVFDDLQSFLQAVSHGKELYESLEKVEHKDMVNFDFSRQNGYLVLVDWEEKKIIGSYQCPMPLGFALEPPQSEQPGLLITCWKGMDRFLRVDTYGNAVDTIQNPWFNHLHSVEPLFEGNSTSHPSGYLITSSGTDLIAQMDMQGLISWTWWAFEHGLGEDKVKDKGLDYRTKYIPSAMQATHVNSAIKYDDKTVLATLFGQGQLIKIAMETGKWDVVLGELQRPHSVRRKHDREGYSLCNSMGGEVVLLDEQLQEEKRVPMESSFIQDALIVGDSVMALSNRDFREMWQPNGDSNRLLEVDCESGEVVGALDFGPNTRLYQISAITQPQARHFQRIWTKLQKAWEPQTL